MPLENLPEKLISISLIHQQQILILSVSRPSHCEYSIKLNESELNVEVVRLSDSGILVQLNGKSYCSYLQETIQNFRVTINNQTVVFNKENDPSILRAPSPGKLVRYIVADGARVKPGDGYAELEVMKMVMVVKVTSNGMLHYTKKPGALLLHGTIIAQLTLDTTEQIRKPDKYLDDFSLFLIDSDSQSTSSANSGESDESPNALRRRPGSDGGSLIGGSLLLERKGSLGNRRGSFASAISEDSRPGNIQPHKILKKALHYIHAILDGYTVSDAKIDSGIKKKYAYHITGIS